jgi:putative nucleotidyltransferase with HDIG domain
MSRSLKLYIAGLVGASALALVITSLAFGLNEHIAFRFWGPATAAPTQAELVLGLAFWIGVTLFASALPVPMPRGMLVSVSIAPILASAYLGGPAAGAFVALIGSTEMREVRGRIPWYGTLANHAGVVLPTVAAGLIFELVGRGADALVIDFAALVLASIAYFTLNVAIVSVLLALRTGQPVRGLLLGDTRNFAASLVGLAPISWLMAQMYAVAWWAALLFALPLYTTRLAYHNFIEMREMFTQTITALAGAVDKRDPYTSKHSWRVKEIAGDIGRAMRLGEADLEALEWGGLLHDVGKIGVPDNVLLKQERLNKEERMIMNAHPVLGAQIIQPVTRLSRELPIIRHHHEWYNGSGYPDRLIGDEIPLLARILHCADAFEAMTAQRPYRMTPLTAEQALGELRKFAGIQFDPKVVDAFVKTTWVEGVNDPGRTVQPRPIPMISQHANRAAAVPSSVALNSNLPVPGSPADVS